MHPRACYAINPLPLSAYPSVKCKTCFACQFPPADKSYPPFHPGGREAEMREGEVRGGCEREVTEDSDSKGHPLSAEHSVAARPQ